MPDVAPYHAPLEAPHLTDLGNADRFAADHHELARYVWPWRSWLLWDQRRWAPDQTGAAARLARATVLGLYALIPSFDDKDERRALLAHAKASESDHRLAAMLHLAQSLLWADPGAVDRDPWLLNVLNGTLDLRTGDLRAHRREDYLTKLAPVEYLPQASAPQWDLFLQTILPSASVRAFLQTAVGYALTGDTSEQMLFMLSGTGANGKSTFLKTLNDLLGDYALTTPSDTFMVKRDGAIPNDLARLRGARFVTAVETHEGKRLDEALVKQMTGGDTISARFLHQEFFDYTPSFKVFLAVNYRPRIRGTEHAIWRRLRLVPFGVTIAEEQRDRSLLEKLRAEWPGILAWALAGCARWREAGRLGTPEDVVAATARYRASQDALRDFLDECCILDPAARISGTDLHGTYRDWCRKEDEKPMYRETLYARLEERGLTRSGVTTRSRWVGIRLKTILERDQPEPLTEASSAAEPGANDVPF